MHGIILVELKKYVQSKVGPGAWETLLTKSGLPHTAYLATLVYPDEQMVALVTTASSLTGTAIPVLLEDFGEFLVPGLIKTYRAFLRPDWRTLDTIEHTEVNIHKAVRLRNPGASPPALSVTRKGPDEVVIVYDSPRKMCGVAKGIVRGIARHYDERITLSESTCMHHGDRKCTISVRLVGG
jgi:Haem-NO-binding